MERLNADAPELRHHHWLGHSIHSNGALGIALMGTVNASPPAPTPTSATGHAGSTQVACWGAQRWCCGSVQFFDENGL